MNSVKPPPYQMPSASNPFNQRKWQMVMVVVFALSLAALIYGDRETTSPLPTPPVSSSPQTAEQLYSDRETTSPPPAPPVSSSPQTAEQLYRQAIQYINQNNWQAAVPYLEQAAQAGHARAQNNLGVAYIEGRGIDAQPTLGCTWIGKAAQQAPNDMLFQDNWGRCLTEIPQPNYTQALQALTPPAQAGLSGAQFSLGNLYLRGQGVPANAAVGLYWVGLAAAQGEKNALEQMGHCLIARECSKQYYQPALGYAVIILAYQRAQPSNPLQKFTHYWRQKYLYSQLSDSDQQHAQNYIQQWQNLTSQALVEQIWLESGAVHKQP